MALEKMTSSPGISALKSTDSSKKGSSDSIASALGGADFKKALESVASKSAQQATATSGMQAAPQSGGASVLKFSNHAIERMHSRGITFAPEQMQNIEKAVTKAAAKGSKDTLVLTGDSALIVSIKNNTVVTVMDRAAMKDNVFTNIDSTVVI